MPGKSKLTADAAEQAVLRALSKSEHRGEADRARAILLTLEGRKAAAIAAVLGVHISTVRNWRGYFAYGGVAGLRRRPRPGQQARIGPHAGAIAAAILTEDTHHDGGWTLPRLRAEIARRGGPAISLRWLSHQLRQRGLPSVAPATLSRGARTPPRSRPAVSTRRSENPGRSRGDRSGVPRRIRGAHASLSGTLLGPAWIGPAHPSPWPGEKNKPCSAPLIRCTGAFSYIPAPTSAPSTLSPCSTNLVPH